MLVYFLELIMKKKSTNKSKERDKSKTEESKSHKHSRRKRKSSSSESDNETVETRNEVTDEVKTRRSAAAKKEFENNVITTRTTRHSKRLAAISAGSDEIKEELNEIASPVKTGKSSPFSGECKGSPSKESKVISLSHYRLLHEKYVVVLIITVS